MRPHRQPRRPAAFNRATAFLTENAAAFSAPAVAAYRRKGADLPGMAYKALKVPPKGQATAARGRGGGSRRTNR